MEVDADDRAFAGSAAPMLTVSVAAAATSVVWSAVSVRFDAVMPASRITLSAALIEPGTSVVAATMFAPERSPVTASEDARLTAP